MTSDEAKAAVLAVYPDAHACIVGDSSAHIIYSLDGGGIISKCKQNEESAWIEAASRLPHQSSPKSDDVSEGDLRARFEAWWETVDCSGPFMGLMKEHSRMVFHAGYAQGRADEQKACVQRLEEAANAVAPPERRTNQVDRHVADVLRRQAEAIRNRRADERDLHEP